MPECPARNPIIFVPARGCFGGVTFVYTIPFFVVFFCRVFCNVLKISIGVIKNMIPSPFYPPIIVVENVVDCYIYERGKDKKCLSGAVFRFLKQKGMLIK